MSSTQNFTVDERDRNLANHVTTHMYGQQNLL